MNSEEYKIKGELLLSYPNLKEKEDKVEVFDYYNNKNVYCDKHQFMEVFYEAIHGYGRQAPATDPGCAGLHLEKSGDRLQGMEDPCLSGRGFCQAGLRADPGR